MPLRTMDILGNPYVGIHSAANGEVLFVPPTLDDNVMAAMGEILMAEPVRLSIGGSTIIGSLMSLNSRGAIVPSFIEEAELEILTTHLEVGGLDTKMNAGGNTILASDKAALVHPRLPAEAIRLVEDTLDVEVVKGTVAGLGIVGAAAVVTSRGVLCHPKVTPEEKDQLRSVFGVEVKIGTANYGAPLLGACLVANTKGCMVGTSTTGIELGRIEEALDLYDS